MYKLIDLQYIKGGSWLQVPLIKLLPYWIVEMDLKRLGIVYQATLRLCLGTRFALTICMELWKMGR